MMEAKKWQDTVMTRLWEGEVVVAMTQTTRLLNQQAEIAWKAGEAKVIEILRKTGWDRAADDVVLYLGKADGKPPDSL